MEARDNGLSTEAKVCAPLARVAAVFVLAVLFTLVCEATAVAETFTVTNANDSGAGSLREAIAKANSTTGGDKIAFADGQGGTMLLGESAITDEAGLSVDGGGDVTVAGTFAVSWGAAFSLRNITVAGGNSSSGGGIDNNGGTVEVSGSTFSGNHADDYGGAIVNGTGGTLTVSDSTFTDNHAADTGGGIANFGTLIVSSSTISGNFGDFDGGGIYNEGGTVDVTNSTISGNDGGMFGGGGILSYGGTVNVVNSTISGNISNGEERCGGICGSDKTLRNTIVANNEGGNCGGPITDGGYNIDEGGTCGFTRDTGSLPNTDPLLDPNGLQDNGGPTKTIALRPDSPAVDLVAPDACPPPQTDQRGVERPQGGACDSGAYELEQRAEPKTKVDCKKGGWREFGFKNQGQCITAVNHASE